MILWYDNSGDDGARNLRLGSDWTYRGLRIHSYYTLPGCFARAGV